MKQIVACKDLYQALVQVSESLRRIMLMSNIFPPAQHVLTFPTTVYKLPFSSTKYYHIHPFTQQAERPNFIPVSFLSYFSQAVGIWRPPTSAESQTIASLSC